MEGSVRDGEGSDDSSSGGYPEDPQGQKHEKKYPDIDFSTVPFTKDSYDATCNVLRALAASEHAEFYESHQCRPLRALLQPLFNRQRQKMYAGKTPDELASRKQKKIKRAQELERQRREDKEFLQRTVLRAGRMRKLEQIASHHGGGGEVPLILDGAVDDGFNDAVTLSAADCAAMVSAPAIQGEQANAPVEGEEARLHVARGCYICKRRYQTLHHFYDTLCESCATLNWAKRMQSCDLRGRICLVTGARVKIGFQSALKLLRCGAVVIATSRFPGDTALRYAMQNDYEEWSPRLHIFGVDLRDLAAIEQLCTYLNSNFPWLDCIINNACQTIRRPPAYYSDVVETERRVAAMCRGEAPGREERVTYASTLSNHWRYEATREANLRTIADSETKALEGVAGTRDETVVSYRSSVDASAMVMVTDDLNLDPGAFPEQKRDVNSQQLDLRRTNSWLLTLSSGNISTPELAEVFAINAMAPFILASKLTPLLTAPRPSKQEKSHPTSSSITACATTLTIPSTYQYSLAENVLLDMAVQPCVDGESDRRVKRQRDAWKGGGDISGHFFQSEGFGQNEESNEKKKTRASETPAMVPAADCRFIVNVSSMEGKFYRRKLATHPHTNMAKAALNMLTRTSAAEYEKHGIYMTAVDTGWINDENPIERAAKTAEKHNFATPLDEVDAAARILDPMLGPLSIAESSSVHMCSPPFGCFLKDYFPTEW